MLWTARYWLASLILQICFVVTASNACAELLLRVVDNKIQAMPNSKIWGKTSFKDIMLELHYRSRVRPSSLLVGRDHPNGSRFLVMFPGYGVLLPLKFDDAFEGLDKFGELYKSYYVQVAEHDFDRDGTPELILQSATSRRTSR
jgi:hypothetical protein